MQQEKKTETYPIEFTSFQEFKHTKQTAQTNNHKKSERAMFTLKHSVCAANRIA